MDDPTQLALEAVDDLRQTTGVYLLVVCGLQLTTGGLEPSERLRHARIVQTFALNVKVNRTQILVPNRIAPR